MNNQKNKKRGFLKWIILIVILIGAMQGFSSCGKSSDGLELIRMDKITRGDLWLSVTATGTVKPYNRVEVKAPIAGRIEDILVREGEMVNRGQILAYMSSVERAVLLDAARGESPETLKRWEEAYKPAPLLSPLDGMVIVRSVEPGQTVSTTDAVVVVSDRLIVEGLVDETDLSLIKIGQRAEIRLDAYRNETFEGKVDHITFESTLENNVNVYKVDVLPEEVPDSFRSGMTANVTFIVKEAKDVLLAPSEAIMDWPKELARPFESSFAIYQKNDKKKLTPIAVELGDTDGSMTIITKGLSEDEKIAIVRKTEKQSSANIFRPSKPSSSGTKKS